MRTGFFKGSITPKLEDKVELCGYGFYLNRVPQTILDEVSASAIVVEGDNKQKAAIVSLDLVGLDEAQVTLIKARLSHQTKIPFNNIVVSTTHTHSAPAAMYIEGCGEYNKEYAEQIVFPSAIMAVMLANDNLMESEVGFGRKNVKGLSENRVGGTSIDDSLDVMRFKSKRKSSAMVNFGCHPVVLGKNSSAISRDYPGEIVDYLEEKRIQSLFTNGCAGDINPSVIKQNGGKTSYTDVLDMGRVLGKESRSLLDKIETKSGDVHVEDDIVRLPFDRGEFFKMLKSVYSYFKVRKDAGAPGYQSWKTALRLLNSALYSYNNSRNGINARVTGVRIGNQTLLALPGEIFSSTGLKIKEKFPNTTILGYSNGNHGYIAPKEEHERKVSYETGAGQLIYNGLPFHVETEEILRRASEEVLKKLN